MPTHRQILIAALGLWPLLLSASSNALSSPHQWVDQIEQHLQEQMPGPGHAVSPGSERYLVQLQPLRQAVVKGHVVAVQTEMNQLVRMVATKEGGLSDSAAQALLFYISQVTPSEYLDQTTKNHLRIVRDLVAFKAELTDDDVSGDVPYGTEFMRRPIPRASWLFGWMGLSPIVTLGAGILALVAVGAIAMFVVGLRGPSPQRR
ncbi:MAG TPA: hypothetical protein VJ746_03520 [Nitrospira sp.]|nr:hypothetical protein [Nitrospira sp.]